jgi:tetratricopeptide (TPR) repeat protein
MADTEIVDLWSRGELRAACDASARAMAGLVDPFRDRGAGDDLEMATRWHDHGHRCWHLARFVEAADALDRAFSIRSARLGDDHLDTLATLDRLAALAHYTNDHELAAARWQAAIAKLDDTDGPRGLRTAIARRNFSTLLRHTDTRSARRELERALAFFRRSVTDDDLEYLALRKANAMLAYDERAHPVAIRLAEEALEHSPLPDAHPFVAAAKLVAARSIAAIGDRRVARTIVDEVIAVFERSYGDHPLLAIALAFAGRLARDDDELAVARALLERALAMYRCFYPSSPSTDSFRTQLYLVLVDLGETQAAEALADAGSRMPDAG